MATNSEVTYNALTKIWSGPVVPRTSYAEDASIGKVLLEAMRRNPEHTIQVCHPSGREYTNKQLAILSISIANHFTHLRMQQCDMIGICASNSDLLIPLFCGAMFKGLTVCTVDAVYDKNGIKHGFGLSRPKLMFCDGNVYAKVKQALEEIGLNIPIYTMREHMEGNPSIKEFLTHQTESLDYEFEPLKMGVTQTAIIVLSSGTTGLPKGCCCSNEDMLDYIKFSPDERFLHYVALDWWADVFIVVSCILSDVPIIISKELFCIDSIFDMIEKYRATFLYFTQWLMARMLTSPRLKTTDLSSIKACPCGGSTLPYAVAQQLRAYMPNARFHVRYGMTETRFPIARGVLTEKTGLIGPITPNYKVKILDDDGQHLGPNEVGEICAKTPRKWLGYVNNEKATDADGYIVTGDLGYIDALGNLNVIDRKKDIFKYLDFQVTPTEIEQVIHEFNDVLEVCVIGLPDFTAINLPGAAVVKKSGNNLTEHEICEHVAQRLDDFKQLRGGVYFLDKMPKTVRCKMLRREVLKICEKLRSKSSENNFA